MANQNLLDKIIQKLFSLIFIFGLAWVVFASFELHFQPNLFKGYYIRENIAYPYTIIYRVEQNHVVHNGSLVISEYEDCAIFDTKNWSCTYSDKSGTFGAKDGIYFSRLNTIDFPHLAEYGDDVGISRFRYMTLSCQLHGLGWDSFYCLFRPFFV
jgi:hypothetical protein